jgi:STAS-like domain of unknown function (DUF4325)
MSSFSISVAKDFSPSPAGRFPEDGPFPGAVFRDRILIPAIKGNDEVVVDLDGTDGFGSSFLEETFGGLVRSGYPEAILLQKLKVRSSRASYEVRVWRYIKKAESQKSK